MTPTFARSAALPIAGPLPALARFADILRALSRAGLPRFGAIGAVGLATDALVFSLLSGSGFADAAARALSLAVATCVTWRLNRRFTFGASGRRTHAEALRYVAVALCAQGFNYALFLSLRALAPEVPALLTLTVSAASAAAFSFAGQSIVAFRSPLGWGRFRSAA